MPVHLRSRRGRSRCDPLVDEHASRLVRQPISALSDGIHAVLAAMGPRLRADRVALWDLRPGERALVRVQEWSRRGCADSLDRITADEHPWLLAQLKAGRRIAFRRCAMLPREASRERKLFAHHGPRSAAILPLEVGGATVGMLVIGTIRRERSWGRATLAFLEREGVALSGALERRSAHDSSTEAQRRLSGVLDATSDGILLVRPSGQVELANGRASAIFLRTPSELCCERIQDLLARGTDAARPFSDRTTEALLAGVTPLQVQVRRGDGTTVLVELALREVRAPGAPLFCCRVRDVGDERRAREEADVLRNELAFMGRTAMLAELGAGIAHELNQPLTAILSNAEAAQRLARSPGAGDGAEIREALEEVVNETRRAARVLASMRDMARHRVERLPVDMAEVLGNVARYFREEAVARSVRLSLEIVPGLPPVLGDRVQLEQVAVNLVLNAFEAMSERAIAPRTIVVRARPSIPEGVDVSVQDSGSGLSGDALAHAFDAHFTTKARGLGMGLPICRSILEAHGGRLLARNNADRGATLEFHLPAAPLAGSAARRRVRA